MKQDYFLILYSIIKNKYIAFLGAQIIYLYECVKFIFQKVKHKKKIPSLDPKKAERVVTKCWMPSDKKTDIHNQPINPLMDLSIIVPIYNRDKETKQCIDSLLNQKTDYNYEIIIVDDGSQKSTKNLLLSYSNVPRIRLITQDNTGISGARNAGINSSVGKYLMFVDGDDVVHNNCVQVLMTAAYEKSCDIVMGAHALVKKKDNAEISRRNIIYSDLNVMNYRDNDFIMNYAGLPWGKVYKRDLFNQVRFPTGYWYEDSIIHFLIFRMAKSFYYVSDVVYDYMWYEGNFSKTQGRSKNQCIERFWIVDKMLQENDRIGLPHDVVLYKVMLNHLGRYLYKGIQNLSTETQEAVFVLSREMVIQNRLESPYHLNYYMKQLERAFFSNDFGLWKLVSENL